MKTVDDLAELQRLALATGAEVTGPDVRFNTGKVRAIAPRQAAAAPTVAFSPAPPAAPVTPLPDMIPRAEVERMIAANNERVTQQFTSIIRELRAPTPAPSRGVPKEWAFEITYDSHHAITNVTAKAKP